jgi:hypothetical protein
LELSRVPDPPAQVEAVEPVGHRAVRSRAAEEQKTELVPDQPLIPHGDQERGRGGQPAAGERAAEVHEGV